MSQNKQPVSELLDVVTKHNEPTKETVVRSKAHSEGIWHRVVHIYIFRSKPELEILVHLRSKLKDLSPNCWDTRFGGHFKSGSSVEETFETELQEELGLDVSKHKVIDGDWLRRDFFPNREFTKVFFLEYLGDFGNLKFNDGEVQEIKWMNAEEIKKELKDNNQNWASSLEEFINISNTLTKKL